MARRIGDQGEPRPQPQRPRHRMVDDEALPRRVRHLIVLPGGGGNPAEDPGDDPRADLGGYPDRDLRADVEPDLEASSQRQAEGKDEAASTTNSLSGPAFSLPSSTRLTEDARTSAFAATQAAAAVAPLEAPAHLGLRLRLRVISRTVTAPKAPTMPFIVLASVLVSLAVLGLVVLRVMVDQASFHVDDLSTRVAQQQSSLTQLNYQVSVADAPGAIANRAAALGMVPATQIQPLPVPSVPASVGGSTGSAAGSTAGGGG